MATQTGPAASSRVMLAHPAHRQAMPRSRLTGGENRGRIPRCIKGALRRSALRLPVFRARKTSFVLTRTLHAARP